MMARLRLLPFLIVGLVGAPAYAEAPLGMLPAPLIDSETVVPLSQGANEAAIELARLLGASTADGAAYSACIITEDSSSSRVDTTCIKQVADKDGVKTNRVIAVTHNENDQVVAHSVRIKDAAAMRYSYAQYGDTKEANNAAMLSIAKELRGSFSEVDLFGITPLMALFIGGLLLLLLDAFSRPGAPKDFIAYSTSLIGLATFALAYVAWENGGFPYARELFGGMFSADRFSLFFAMIIGLGVAISAPLSLGFFKGHQIERGEFYPLLVFSAVGMLAMVQSTDLFVTFISLEVMSLAIYVLVGFMRHEKHSAEGALKYFLLGAFSSGFLVYGIALVYGVTGTTQLGAIANAIALHPEVVLNNPILMIGVFLILGSFLFKIAAVPFHMWTPDAYQAAPSPVTGFMAFGVKAAAFGAMLRTFGTAFWGFRGVGISDNSENSHLGWYVVIFLLAAITMMVGNIVALLQTNIKRMLAYSSIAHAGYLMVGLASMAIEIGGNEKTAMLDAGRGVVFYLMVYGFSSLLAFGAIGAIERHGENLTEFENLRGAARRHPGAGLAMVVAMLSFAGIPPTGGFFAKLVLFREAIRSGNTDLLYLTIIGVLASVIGVYYYLKVIVVMYMEDPSKASNQEDIKRPSALYAALLAAGLLVIYLGVSPGRYISLSNDAIRDMVQLPAEAKPEPSK
jgi:NADH-quinone oxidoreductase subunit N